MTTWWKIDSWSEKIAPVDVASESTQWVTVREEEAGVVRPSRHLKVSEHESYHPTWEAARDDLLDRERIRIDSAMRQLAAARERQAAIEALVEPTVETRDADDHLGDASADDLIGGNS